MIKIFINNMKSVPLQADYHGAPELFSVLMG